MSKITFLAVAVLAPLGMTSITMAQTDSDSNPLLVQPTARFGALPFDAVRAEHFMPAFQKAMAEEKAEFAAIVDNPEPPTFANTIEALERTGELSGRVFSVFSVFCSSATNEEIQELEAEIAPIRAKHAHELWVNPKLFSRIDALFQKRESLGLDAEQMRLLEIYHEDLRRSGAGLDEKGRERLAELSERLATLETQFSQNVQAEEDNWMLVLDGGDELAGLPSSLVSAAAAAAEERGLKGKYVITLSRSSVEPFVTYSSRRDLREKAAKGWAARGDNGNEYDNKGIIRDIVAARTEKANLLGYPTFAHYATGDKMAGSPERALKLLSDVWEPAKAQFARDRELIAEMARKDGIEQLEFWDWRYYSNKVRVAHYSVDDEEVKQYFALNQMIEAIFYTANRLFGVTFTPVEGIPVFHPDVRVWEVKGSDGEHLALFYMDNFARTGKRSGAWMTSYRDQSRLDGVVRPLVSNNNNISKADPALLTLDDALTLFHEFGHGLHGILTDVKYESLSGTEVNRDLVEMPSQLLEHWLLQPEILNKFARHHKTGEPMPKDLVDRILAAQNYGEGFGQVEYLASAIVDLELHKLTDLEHLDVNAFEKEMLEKYGMPREIIMRHRLPQFHHLFDDEHYAAGYYTYLWAAVLEYDMFEAFEEAGDIFDPATAKRLKDYLFTAGNVRKPEETFILLRGRMPTVEPLLRGKGFIPEKKDSTASL